jgi:hypothetical protein
VRFIRDLLLRYLISFIVLALYGALIFLTDLNDVIPKMGMSTSHYGSVMLFVLVIYVPICSLMLAVISVWCKPIWLELGLSFLIPLMAYIVLPAFFEHFYHPDKDVLVAGSAYQYADRIALIRFIDYLGSTVAAALTAFLMNLKGSCEQMAN